MRRAARSFLAWVTPPRLRPALARQWARYRYFLLFPAYLGGRFACPFCGGKFRKLMPRGLRFPVLKETGVVGAGYRENVVCPRCYSFDRERLVYLYLRQRTDLFTRPVRLLHVAPEMRLQAVLQSFPNIDYHSADLQSPLAMTRIDLANIPYADSTFDVIICNHVLEHVDDDRKSMSELHRVLKRGGYAILLVPVATKLAQTYESAVVRTPEQREQVYGQKDHVRLYGLDYKDRLEGAGFSVAVRSFSDEFGEEAARRYALLDGEPLYVCRKPAAVPSQVPSA